MKYKIGDVVKLKSAEELIKLGTWYKECAEQCGGKSYKIEEFIENPYRGENTTFGEESIECLVSEAEMPKQETTYTFNELKKRVDDLKDYLLKYTSSNKQIVEIHLQTSAYCMGYNVISKIGITD